MKKKKLPQLMKTNWLALALFLAMPLSAKTVYVKPSIQGGDDTADGTSWETAFATPTKAFSMVAETGDIVAIMQGTYNMTDILENTSVATNVEIQGGYTGIGNERNINPDNTIFEYKGSAAVRVLGTFKAGLKFSGITFQNLKPSGSQYGIFCQATVSFTLEDCIIKEFQNKAGAYIRGIIRINSTATLTINRCQFINCSESSTAANNAVITRNGGTGTVNISNSIIRGTTMKPFIAASSNMNVSITNCTFINNAIGAVTGLSGGSRTANITNSIFYNSTLAGTGNLNYSYYSGSTIPLTNSNCVSFTDASTVFADQTDFYPAATFAGIDAGDNNAVVGDKDVAGNVRTVNSTIDIGAYENIPAPIATAGTNVASIETFSAYYPYGATAQIPFTVEANCVPDPIVGVAFTGVAPNYIANVVVKAPQEITFTATQANYEVTVNTTNATVTSPTLIDGKYNSSSTSIIYFTLAEGAENPAVEMNQEPVIPTLISGNDYSVELTNISGSTNVEITASLKNYTVTVAKNNYIASISGLNEGTQTKQHGTIISDLTFTLETGAHTPYVTVDGEIVTATESEGTYSIPAITVTNAVNISIAAFAANVLPVNEDTYQRRNGEISGNHANYTYLETRGEPSGYAATPLLKFVPTEAMKAVGYNKAELKLVPLTTNATNLTYTVRQFPTNIYSTIHDVPANNYADMWNSESAPVVEEANQAVTFTKDNSITLTVTDDYILDFPTEIILSVIKSSNGTIDHFASLENGNPDYVPQLVFSYVDPGQGTSIPDNMIDDSIVSTQYYTLQGIEIMQPVIGNMYIVRTCYKSGKCEAKVIYFSK